MAAKDKTQSDLAACTFKPLNVKFETSNHDWAMSHLVSVRIATVVVNKTQEELEKAVNEMVDERIVSELLEKMSFIKNHLEALVDLVQNALTRQFICLERLGYSSDCPPPDGLVH